MNEIELEGGTGVPKKSTLYANIFSKKGNEKLDGVSYKNIYIRGSSNSKDDKVFLKEAKKNINKSIKLVYSKLSSYFGMKYDKKIEPDIPAENDKIKDVLEGTDWYDMPSFIGQGKMKLVPSILISLELPFRLKKPSVGDEKKEGVKSMIDEKKDKISKKEKDGEEKLMKMIDELKKSLTKDDDDDEDDIEGGNKNNTLEEMSITSGASSWWVPTRPSLLSAKGLVYVDKDNKKNKPKYPIYVISHQRDKYRSTIRYLDACELSYFVVVRKSQRENYEKTLNKKYATLLTLPEKGDKDFDPIYDLYPNGSIPQRNYVWKHARKMKKKPERHWILDDNMPLYFRYYRDMRTNAFTNCVFRSIEDYVDRYKNIRIAGHQYSMFVVPSGNDTMKPVLKNTRIFSSILLWNGDADEIYAPILVKQKKNEVENTDDTQGIKERNKRLNDDPIFKGMNEDKKKQFLKEQKSFEMDRPLFRWEGSYNEDVDLSTRILKAGYATALFYHFPVQKLRTGTQAGGNIANVYADKNADKYKAQSILIKHPDIVDKITYRYKRWHHQANFNVFHSLVPFIWKDGLEKKFINKKDNNYGMELIEDKKASLAIQDVLLSSVKKIKDGENDIISTYRAEMDLDNAYKQLEEKPLDKKMMKKIKDKFDNLYTSLDYFKSDNKELKKTIDNLYAEIFKVI
jgi:hypothetical protein